MNKKILYVGVISIAIIVTSVAALVVVNPSWKVEERLVEERLFQGESFFSTAQFNGVGAATNLSKGDKIRFTFSSVAGDPADFYILTQNNAGDYIEHARWKNVSTDYGWCNWTVPETNRYLFTLYTYGKFSSVEVEMYREYIQHLFP